MIIVKKIFLILLLIAALLSFMTACKTPDDNSGNIDPDKDTDTTPDETKEGIAFDITGDISVDVGKTLALKIKNLATGMQTSNLLWSSDNEAVATVSTSGVLTGVSQGSANITATTLDGKYTVSAQVSVVLRLSGVQLSYEEYDLEIGDSVQIVASPMPENFVGATYTWLSGAPSVASVDENGLVTAHSLGNTSIMVSAEPGGHTAICSITVGKYADSITLAPEELTINRDVSMQLEFSMLPADATSRPRWKSSDESVAIVNSGGVITALSCGETTITVTTTNGLSASCKVTVISALTGFEFVEESITVSKGSRTDPNIIYFPEDATNKNIIWSSSNEKVAKIVDGKIVALKNGTVTLTAESEDGGYINTLTVTVNNPLISIEFEGEKDAETGKYPTLQMQCTDTLKLSPIITPADADEIPYFEWTSSNVNVATVSSSGVITAHTIGTATITVTAPNGITASFDLEVSKKIYPVEEFYTLSGTYYMNPNDLLALKFKYIPSESEEDAVIIRAVSSNAEVAIWNFEHSMIIAQGIGECEIEFFIANFNGTTVSHKVTVYVVADGTSYDDEYKSETHDLRDGFERKMKDLKNKLVSLEKRVSELVSEIERLRALVNNGGTATVDNEENNQGTGSENNGGTGTENGGDTVTPPAPDPNAELLKQYENELVSVRLEIAKTESEIEDCKAKFEQDEDGLAEKYSCVKESITYDPSSDRYPEENFVKVSDYTDSITSDLKYAGTDNETGKKIYDFEDAYLRYGTLKKLVEVANFFATMDDGKCRIVIVDAYRPTAAQDVIWDLLGTTDRVYGDFSRGNAVCVMLTALDGTPLDNPDAYMNLFASQMASKGFLALDSDWCFVDVDSYDIERDLLSDKVIVTPPNAQILLSYPDEAFLSDGQYTHFTDETAQNTDWDLLFETNVKVTDFKLLAIDDTDGIFVEGVLFTLDELTPDKPLVVSTHKNDATVNRAISYTDSDGQTKSFLIRFSALDGSVSLEHFEA